MPPADEVNILRGQIFMMKNQILYERNKRELHAKRNRRLLRKITTANALEEQTKAQVKLLNQFFTGCNFFKSMVGVFVRSLNLSNQNQMMFSVYDTALLLSL